MAMRRSLEGSTGLAPGGGLGGWVPGAAGRGIYPIFPDPYRELKRQARTSFLFLLCLSGRPRRRRWLSHSGGFLLAARAID